jgi:hypothetical protein
VAERPGVARAERVESLRVDLANVARPVDDAGDDRDDAARAGGDRDDARVAKIASAVGVARRRRPHRRGQHDGLGRCDDTVEKERRLLERVAPVRDHDADDLGAGEVTLDGDGESAPGREVHVLAVELGDLLALDRDRGGQLQRADEHRDRQRSRAIAEVVVGRRRLARDRPSGAEHDDGGGRALHFSETG